MEQFQQLKAYSTCLVKTYANAFAEFTIFYFLPNAFVFKFSDIKVVRVLDWYAIYSRL